MNIDHFLLLSPGNNLLQVHRYVITIHFPSSLRSRMHDVRALIDSEMTVLFVQWTRCLNQLTPHAVAACWSAISAKSPQELQGMVGAAKCPQMEFVCCIWANPRCSRIPFFLVSLDVCKALDERTLCVSTLILSCVYTWRAGARGLFRLLIVCQ